MTGSASPKCFSLSALPVLEPTSTDRLPCGAEPSALQLRRLILDTKRESAPTSMLDCAAHMLLYFDQPRIMQLIGLRHLLDRLSAGRGALIYGSPVDAAFQVYVFERRLDQRLPHVSDVTISDPTRRLRIHWQPDCPTVTIFSAPTRAPNPTDKGQFSCWLEHRREHFGLLYLERLDEMPSRDPLERDYLATFVAEFLAPLLAASAVRRTQLTRLTKAELCVLRLAKQGLSYKRIAAELGKSPNTVDNQLRQLREKFGAHNQFELLRACEAAL